MTGKEGALAALTSHTGLLKYNVYVTYTLVYTYRAESCYPQTLKIPMCVVETPCCRYGCICGPYSPHAVDMGFVVGPVPYAAEIRTGYITSMWEYRRSKLLANADARGMPSWRSGPVAAGKRTWELPCTCGRYVQWTSPYIVR